MSKKRILWGRVILAAAILIAIIALIVILVSRGCKRGDGEFEEYDVPPVEVEPAEPQYLYDICIDSLYVEKGEIEPNQTLSDMLVPKGVSQAVVNHIANDCREVLDVRKIRGGNTYYLLASNDTTQTPLFWIYEIDYRNTAVFSLTDSLTAWCITKDIDLRMERTSGTITSSLWNAVVGNGGDAALAVRLSDIYAWTIDFFGIQEGDSFDAVYEREYVGDKSVGLGKVHYCSFVHCGDTLTAIAFEQNGKTDYFNDKGENLRKAFLKAPLSYSRISSTFSNSRLHPVYKYYRPHHGVDYAAPAGTPVYSIGDGVVITKAYQKGGAGNYLKIKHNDTYTTSYMHLKGYAKGITQGCRVKQGQLIGYVGSTGASTGPHLDFRVFKNGTPIDPLKMDSPPADPIQGSYREQFGKVVKYWREALQHDGPLEPYHEEIPLVDSLQLLKDSIKQTEHP